VLLDRIDRQQRRLQFALLPDEGNVPQGRPKRSKTAATATGERPHSSPKRTGKKKVRAKAKKAKGKRR